MYIFEGVGLLLAAVVVYAWAYAMHNRPVSPSWAKRQLFASVVSLILVTLAPLGAGLIVAGLMQPLDGVQVAGLALLAVSPFILRYAIRATR
jgi:drug/metabolite transporter (DMT)-like permease